jgi:hypothetical protein
MLTHKLQTKIYKRGYLELRNLPFVEGTQIEIVISKKKRKKNLQKLCGRARSHILAGGMPVPEGRPATG